MKKGLPIIILLLIGVVGFLVWQKSQVKVEPIKQETTIKKIDLSTQPEWVQKLKVSARKGTSANSLANFTLTVEGLAGVESLTYVVQYQTSNKGAQGALSMTPIKVSGPTFTKTIDLGTCSTKSCVRHDGVTSIDVELDFMPTGIWTGTLNLQ